MLRSFPCQVTLNTRPNEDSFGCFDPDKAQSASEVCELYQQALQERAMAILKGGQTMTPPVVSSKRVRADTEATADDDLSIISSHLDDTMVDSDMEDSSEATSTITYLSDIDSIAMRRQQINPSHHSNCPCQVIRMESLDVDEEEDDLTILDDLLQDVDDTDLQSKASSVDTLFSFDMDCCDIHSQNPERKIP